MFTGHEFDGPAVKAVGTRLRSVEMARSRGAKVLARVEAEVVSICGETAAVQRG